LDSTADIFTRNTTEEKFKLSNWLILFLKELYVTTFPRQDIIFESQQNEWIDMMRRNNREPQGQDKSPPSNALLCPIFDSDDQRADFMNPPSLSPLSRKERKQQRNCRTELQSIERTTNPPDKQT
jgi:hypothetical protein